ncbi:PIN domain-containing protein [Methylococcus mesophilus]|uniref:PIN domain-containing protein n=1 Tax=Methylococcus mesophilus TaxID=2993564 RepID=UPI00224AA950|nr:PIN domain-containing protein [Methylococcus mesophilus]UZR30848.1 PIN domain-containing protein [Methylococcus mesophilus]
MIVVDANILAYLYLPTAFTPLAERLLEHEPDWRVPLLWRSELRNVLTLYLRRRLAVPLVTADQKVLKNFPRVATSLVEAAR